jgi:aspartyl-tRNA(Asn)/glutamyl-tRNA(Gln) amidotransferase subunit B
MPGARPMPPNEKAVEAAVAISLLLGCRPVIGQKIYIQRKHYDYPDLPSGYQRTSTPLATDGMLAGVRIREIHLEEDPGKYDPVTGSVDFNRSGIPLIEIVTEPDMRSPEEARDFLKELVRVLEYSGRVRGEAGGAMRVDVNVSIEGGARVEIKNINSIKGVYKALKFELMRQSELLRRGERVERETRAFLESQMITIPMRAKETEEDYRYIPDPDLYPLLLTQEFVEKVRSQLPEAPNLRETRLMQQYGISRHEASVIVSEKALADLYEEVCREVNPRLVAEWFRTRLKKTLNYLGLEASRLPCSPAQLSKLLKMVEKGEITPEQGELVMRELVVKPADPYEILQRLGLLPIEQSELLSIIDKTIQENQQAVKDYLGGEEKALDFLVGRAFSLSGRKADPRRIKELLKGRIRTASSTGAYT